MFHDHHHILTVHPLLNRSFSLATATNAAAITMKLNEDHFDMWMNSYGSARNSRDVPEQALPRWKGLGQDMQGEDLVVALSGSRL